MLYEEAAAMTKADIDDMLEGGWTWYVVRMILMIVIRMVDILLLGSSIKSVGKWGVRDDRILCLIMHKTGERYAIIAYQWG